MDLTAGQRKLVFAVIALGLAGLAWYLFLPAARGTASSAGQRGAARAPAPAANVAAPHATPSAATSAASGAAAAPDIYQWLPFTPAGLAAAANVVTRFGDDYDTFSYSQRAASYIAPMRGLISSALAAQLGGGYSAPGVAEPRIRDKQVSTGTTVISSLRAFGPSSITFIAAITQHLADTRGRSQSTVEYAVTVTGGAGTWQVSDIELASVGNL
jgi:hypothetical protein